MFFDQKPSRWARFESIRLSWIHRVFLGVLLLASLIAGLRTPLALAQPSPAASTSASAPLVAPTGANELPGAAPSKELKVGVAGSAPFVVHDKNTIDGIAIDVWESAALRAGIRYSIVPAPSVAEGINLVASGQLDMLIGPVSITAQRAQKAAFTQPYFHAALAILAHPAEYSFWDRLSAIFQKSFFVGVGILLLVLFVVGTLFWLAEFRHNEAQFPRNPIHGIPNGVWLALVTLTTVGYGDRAPVTVAGRMLAGVWMLFAMIGASSLTASIATTLTLSHLDRGQVDSVDELRRRKVAVVSGSTGETFARRHGAVLVQAANVTEALAKLSAHEADALVFDRPALQYFLRNSADNKMLLSEASYEPQGYGFVLPLGSPLEHRLNIALLELEERGEIDRIAKQWLGD